MVEYRVWGVERLWRGEDGIFRSAEARKSPHYMTQDRHHIRCNTTPHHTTPHHTTPHPTTGSQQTYREAKRRGVVVVVVVPVSSGLTPPLGARPAPLDAAEGGLAALSVETVLTALCVEAELAALGVEAALCVEIVGAVGAELAVSVCVESG